MAAHPCPWGGAHVPKTTHKKIPCIRSFSKTARMCACLALVVLLWQPSNCFHPSSGATGMRAGMSRASGAERRAPFPSACPIPNQDSRTSLRGGEPDRGSIGWGRKMPSTEAVMQLTTQLFSGGKMSTQKNLFKVLGVKKTATSKEIRDAYYREARKWHPDKNKHDPNAEARFKQISDAYEVLSNPAKRKAYEEGGLEGLEAHEAAEKLDIKGIVRALFGGGEFEDILGDVGEIPLLKKLMEQSSSAGQEDETEDEEQKKKRELKEAEVMERFEKEEEEMVRQIGEKLLARLKPRAVGEMSEAAFLATCAEWADHLCQAPGGLDLVKMTSKVWRSRGKVYARRFWGLEGMLTRIHDWTAKISTGCSLLVGAMQASKLTREAMVKKNNTKAEKSVVRPEVHANREEDEDSDAVGKGDEEEMEIDKDDMIKIAKVSLDVVWRFGIFLLQDRVRKCVDAMFAQFKSSPQYSRKGEHDLALALLEVSRVFRDQWDAKTCNTNSTLRQGIPIDLDEMAAQASQAESEAAARASRDQHNTEMQTD